MATSTVSSLKPLPEIIRRLNDKHPDARYELDWENPLQLLVGTILAAQWTDKEVNQLTPKVFAKYPDAQAFAKADVETLAEDLKPANFYRNKAKAIQGACQILVDRFNGEVPRTMDEMLTLPGVARKTANVVLNNAFRIPSGIIVDTHVARVSQRMGLSKETKPEKIETELMKIVPKDEWVQFGPAMVLLGRYTCTSQSPKCGDCVMNDLCPKIGVNAEAAPVKAPQKPAPAPTPTKHTSAPAASALAAQLPDDWREALAEEFSRPYFAKLEKFIAAERDKHSVFPPAEDIFNSFKHTPYRQVKVLLLGQDPYHDDGQAHGLCFSVRPGVKAPPSLVNIFKELADDLNTKPVNHGHLTSWAQQGVMMLNAVLTVRAHQPGSHKDQGWETFTDAVIKALNARPEPMVFLLWGAYAHKKQELIDASRHTILTAAHPSPLSAKKFFGSRPFSKANEALKKFGAAPIVWQLPAAADGTISPPVVAEEPPVAVVAEEPAEAPREPIAPAEAVVEVSPVPALLGSVLNHLHSTRGPALLPDCWCTALATEFDKPYFRKLEKFLDTERQEHTIFPAENDVFNAFRLTPLREVRVVLLGDEPLCEEGEADGLALSVPENTAPTPTLLSLFREMRRDVGCRAPTTGHLAPWARQGVLLLNEVLTVREDMPGSHGDSGWEKFTDAALRAVNALPQTVVFVAWGDVGERKRRLITAKHHTVLELPHPDSETFPGSRPFSAINDALEEGRRPAIYWQLFSV